ncbi:MAG: hypothetical protein ACRETU_06320, partial [Steroidobacterales bacterium]
VQVLTEGEAVVPVTDSGGPSTPQGEAFGALIALGYKPVEATKLIKGVDAANASTEDIIRRALQSAVRE